MVKRESVYELGGKGTLSRPTCNPHYEDRTTKTTSRGQFPIPAQDSHPSQVNQLSHYCRFHFVHHRNNINQSYQFSQVLDTNPIDFKLTAYYNYAK